MRQKEGFNINIIIITLIYLNALISGVDPKLAIGIANTESNLKPTAKAHEKRVGGHSYGIFQIRYRTAKDLGFAGNSQQLMDLETNIYFGVKYLASCQKKYGDNPKSIACCYNAGMYRKKDVCTSNQVKKYQRKVLKYMKLDDKKKI